MSKKKQPNKRSKVTISVPPPSPKLPPEENKSVNKPIDPVQVRGQEAQSSISGLNDSAIWTGGTISHGVPEKGKHGVPGNQHGSTGEHLPVPSNTNIAPKKKGIDESSR